ncbi:MAG TPA: hypothetical protein VF228_07955 [Iamia sp.]
MTVGLVLVLGLVATGCSDPLASNLEADRPSMDGPPLVADEDGDLVAAETTTTGGSTSASGPEAVPTAPVPTTTTEPGVAAKAAWVHEVMGICAHEYDGLATTEPLENPDEIVAHMRVLAVAYSSWADRVEALPVPDRQTEANLVEGLRRLRRSVDLLGPAVQREVAGDLDGARRAWWSWAQAISGASTALVAAGVPVECWA